MAEVIAKLAGLYFSALLISFVLTRVLKLLLVRRLDKRRSAYAACVVLVITSIVVFAWTGDVSVALVGYVPALLFWLLVDLQRARRKSGSAKLGSTSDSIGEGAKAGASPPPTTASGSVTIPPGGALGSHRAVNEIRARVQSLRASGKSMREIALELGVTVSTVDMELREIHRAEIQGEERSGSRQLPVQEARLPPTTGSAPPSGRNDADGESRESVPALPSRAARGSTRLRAAGGKVLGFVAIAGAFLIGKRVGSWLGVWLAFLAVYVGLAVYGLSWSFRPALLTESMRSRTRRYDLPFCLAAGASLPIAEGVVGAIIGLLGLREKMPDVVVAIVQLLLAAVYWVALGPIVVKRRVPLLSTLVSISLVIAVLTGLVASLMGLLSFEYFVGLPVVALLGSGITALSAKLSARFLLTAPR